MVRRVERSHLVGALLRARGGQGPLRGLGRPPSPSRSLGCGIVEPCVAKSTSLVRALGWHVVYRLFDLNFILSRDLVPIGTLILIYGKMFEQDWLP